MFDSDDISIRVEKADSVIITDETHGIYTEIMWKGYTFYATGDNIKKLND